MATLGNYYIDSTAFTTATGVFTDADLSTAAPAGYYQSCGVWRYQTITPSGPVLGAPQACPYCDQGDCEVRPPNGWQGEQQGVVDLEVDIGTGIGVYHVTLTPFDIPNGVAVTYDGAVFTGGSSSVYGWLAGPYYGNVADAAAWGFPLASPYQLSELEWSGIDDGTGVGVDFVPTGNFETVAVAPGDFSGTVAAPGEVHMFISKPLAEPRTATIRIVGCVGGDSDAWLVSNRCADALTGLLITQNRASAVDACAEIPIWIGTYYNGPVNGTAGEPGLYDIMYVDDIASQTLASALGAGFYGYQSALGVQGYFEIDANSVITLIGSCPP